MTRPGCELCRAAHVTPWYYEDQTCWIAECEVCETPMVVWRTHGTQPPADELAHMHQWLGEVAAEHFGPIWIDENLRTIPDHYHAHGRPDQGFFGRDFPPRR